ncbi:MULTISPECIES: hypothetical protein [Burkholderiaceae]|uniref:hypothetical protein n=1 Tax=Burkholderia sp. b14 TaxID=1761775 RepID=UPI0009F882DD|nr:MULTISPECIES: hypothetical protein [Burkholderiaceae]
MMLTPLKHLFGWLRHDSRHAADRTSPVPITAPDPAGLTHFDMVWHSDHWQNLLSAPLMDARHYVIEDWMPTTGHCTAQQVPSAVSPHCPLE